MPTSKETVPNKPLSGSELAEIILKETDDMLARDGMFAPHIAYSRVSFEISIALHLDNPLYPRHDNSRRSKAPATNETDPQKLVLEPPPLQNPSSDSIVAAAKRTVEIESPNQARLEHNMPVTLTHVDQQTGAVKDHKVYYDNAGVPPLNRKDEDVTGKWAAAKGVSLNPTPKGDDDAGQE